MVKKRVLSVCGTGGVTSSVIASKVGELAKKNGIDIELTSSQVKGVNTVLSSGKFDLIVTSTRFTAPDDTPVVNCMSYLTGINEEATDQKIVDVLTK